VLLVATQIQLVDFTILGVSGVFFIRECIHVSIGYIAECAACALFFD
jgi:hypothetical protein